MIKNKLIALLSIISLSCTPAYAIKKSMSFEEQVVMVIKFCQEAYADTRRTGTVTKLKETLDSLDIDSASTVAAMCLSYSTGFEDGENNNA